MSVIALGLAGLIPGPGLILGGSSGTVLSINVANSIGFVTPGLNGTAIQLVGDTASPAANSYYGVNGAGVRGWYTDAATLVTSVQGTSGQILVNGLTTAQTGAVILTLDASAAYTVKGNATSSSAVEMALSSLTLGVPGFVANAGTVLGQLTSVSTSFNQFSIQNTSAGVAASSDFVINNNLGTESVSYANLGINSSTYTGSGPLNIAGGAYLFNQSGDLSVGTVGANTLHLFTNSVDRLTVSSAGVITVVSNSLAFAGGSTLVDNGSGALTIAAGAGANNITLSPTGTGGVVVSNNTSSQLLSLTATGSTPFNILLTRSDLTNANVRSYFDATGNFITRNASATGGIYWGINSGTSDMVLSPLKNLLIGTTTDFGSGSGQLKVGGNLIAFGGGSTIADVITGRQTFTTIGTSGTPLWTFANPNFTNSIVIGGSPSNVAIGIISFNGVTTNSTFVGVSAITSGIGPLGLQTASGQPINFVAAGSIFGTWSAATLTISAATAGTSVSTGALIVNSQFSVSGSNGNVYSAGVASFTGGGDNSFGSGASNNSITVKRTVSGLSSLSIQAFTNNASLTWTSNGNNGMNFTDGDISSFNALTLGGGGTTSATKSLAVNYTYDTTGSGSGSLQNAGGFYNAKTFINVGIAAIGILASSNPFSDNPTLIVGHNGSNGGSILDMNGTATTNVAQLSMGGGGTSFASVIASQDTTGNQGKLGFYTNSGSTITSTVLALTLDRSQNATFAGFVYHADGAVGTPGLSFSADTNTGIYRIGVDNIGVTLGGVLNLNLTSTSATFTSVTVSTSTTTGSLINSGGFGNAGAAFIGGGALISGASGANQLIVSGTTINPQINGIVMNSTPTGFQTYISLVTGNGTTGITVSSGNSDAGFTMLRAGALSAFTSNTASGGTTAVPFSFFTSGGTQAVWGASGVAIRHNLGTFTDSSTAASGTAGLETFYSFAAPTLAATNATVTTTVASTVYIAGAPATGTNQTITNAYALQVAAGASLFGGAISITSATTSTSTSTGALVVSGGVGIAGAVNIGGQVAIGAVTSGASALLIQPTNLSGSTSQLGINVAPVFQSTATVVGYTIQMQLATAATSFTMASGAGLHINSPNLGAGSAVTNLYGILIDNQSGGGTSYAIKTGLGQVSFGDVLIVTGNTALNSTTDTSGSGSGALQLAGGAYIAKSLGTGLKLITYNGVATAGWGVPAIQAAGRSVAQNAAVTSVAAYTVGAADGSFLVSANVLVTTSTLHTFTVTCSYTDEGNTSRVLTFTFSNVGGTLSTSIANAGGAVPYEGVPLQIRAKAASTITIGTTGTFTTVVYNAEGSIRQIA